LRLGRPSDLLNVTAGQRKRSRKSAHIRSTATLKIYNDTVEKGPARSTHDALLWELREYGLTRLNNDPTLDRLSALSSQQVGELIATLTRLQPKHDAITNDLIQNLREQL
jgi:hypothetical protein